MEELKEIAKECVVEELRQKTEHNEKIFKNIDLRKEEIAGIFNKEIVELTFMGLGSKCNVRLDGRLYNESECFKTVKKCIVSKLEKEIEDLKKQLKY